MCVFPAMFGHLSWHFLFVVVIFALIKNHENFPVLVSSSDLLACHTFDKILRFFLCFKFSGDQLMSQEIIYEPFNINNSKVPHCFVLNFYNNSKTRHESDAKVDSNVYIVAGLCQILPIYDLRGGQVTVTSEFFVSTAMIQIKGSKTFYG